jgi:hypothetical protein
MKVLLSTLLILAGSSAQAQQFFANSRITAVTFKRATVGTTTADAIATADIAGNVLSWKICNDAVNTSTYLIVGAAADVADDGVRLLPNACFVCDNCSGSLLDSLKVKAQAASNGYSITQYRTK